METVLTPAKKQANLSVKLGLDTKSELQRLASVKKRSVHYLMREAVENYVAEQQAEEEYQKYVENRVMKAYHRLQTEGSNGVPSEQVFSELRKKMKAYANSK